MKRILTAIVLIAVVIAIVFVGPPWLLTLSSALVAGLAVYEFRGLTGEKSVAMPLWWLIAAVALSLALTLPDTSRDWQLPALTFLVLLLFAWHGLRSPLDRVLPDTAVGGFALLYIVYPLSLIPLLRGLEDGTGLLTFLFACVWCGDIAALYIGRALGKRKLAPRLSPNKTIEGSIASICGSVAVGMGVYYGGIALEARGFSVLRITAPAWQMVLLAILLNLAAQLGDLLESAIKRGAGVKDSGTMLPGHGGILDRIDALLLAAPVLWYVLLLRDLQGLFR
jgi:phosphatidate cytidylyltransferase